MNRSRLITYYETLWRPETDKLMHNMVDGDTKNITIDYGGKSCKFQITYSMGAFHFEVLVKDDNIQPILLQQLTFPIWLRGDGDNFHPDEYFSSFVSKPTYQQFHDLLEGIWYQ